MADGVMHKKWTDAKKGIDEKKIFKDDFGKKLDAVEETLAKVNKQIDDADKETGKLQAAYLAAMETLNKYIVEINKDAVLKKNADLGLATIDIARLLKGQVLGAEKSAEAFLNKLKEANKKFK